MRIQELPTIGGLDRRKQFLEERVEFLEKDLKAKEEAIRSLSERLNSTPDVTKDEVVQALTGVLARVYQGLEELRDTSPSRDTVRKKAASMIEDIDKVVQPE